ncbi:MAG: glycine cleavage system protein GcvH [Planctomycetota bacterium]|jgi:glycine cleavage system H protein
MPMSTPTNCRFLDTHEWHVLDGQVVTIGVSRFAVDELTDLTYVELPAVGDELEAGEAAGEMESVKATSDFYSGVSGKVVAVNEDVLEDPSIVNEDPFGKGWLIKVEASDPSQLDGLLDQVTYDEKFPTE